MKRNTKSSLIYFLIMIIFAIAAGKTIVVEPPCLSPLFELYDGQFEEEMNNE